MVPKKSRPAARKPPEITRSGPRGVFEGILELWCKNNHLYSAEPKGSNMELQAQITRLHVEQHGVLSYIRHVIVRPSMCVSRSDQPLDS